MAGGRRNRVAKWVERVALGTIMGAVAFVVERRLMKTLRKREGSAPEPQREPQAELANAPEPGDAKPRR